MSSSSYPDILSRFYRLKETAEVELKEELEIIPQIIRSLNEITKGWASNDKSREKLLDVSPGTRIQEVAVKLAYKSGWKIGFVKKQVGCEERMDSVYKLYLTSEPASSINCIPSNVKLIQACIDQHRTTQNQVNIVIISKSYDGLDAAQKFITEQELVKSEHVFRLENESHEDMIEAKRIHASFQSASKAVWLFHEDEIPKILFKKVSLVIFLERNSKKLEIVEKFQPTLSETSAEPFHLVSYGVCQ